MNKDWSACNKTMQAQLKKKETFSQGIETLLELRTQLMDVFSSIIYDFSREDFNAVPFMNAEGSHSTSLAWSLWHVFRIEDIVCHTLICEDEQVFFKGGYQKRINSPIITTGNELEKEDIAEFSRQLNLDELYSYIQEVKESSERILKKLQFDDMKRKISPEARSQLEALKVVSTEESAVWLIDYWCKKDVRGLLQMPFSRHWIMHAEAVCRIKSRL